MLILVRSAGNWWCGARLGWGYLGCVRRPGSSSSCSPSSHPSRALGAHAYRLRLDKGLLGPPLRWLLVRRLVSAVPFPHVPLEPEYLRLFDAPRILAGEIERRSHRDRVSRSFAGGPEAAVDCRALSLGADHLLELGILLEHAVDEERGERVRHQQRFTTFVINRKFDEHGHGQPVSNPGAKARSLCRWSWLWLGRAAPLAPYRLVAGVIARLPHRGLVLAVGAILLGGG